MITLKREDGYYFVKELDGGYQWALPTLEDALAWIQWLKDNPRTV